MAHNCKEYNTFFVETTEGLKELQLCTQWVEHSVLPTLTGADKDAMLSFFIYIFASVFVYHMIRRLF